MIDFPSFNYAECFLQEKNKILSLGCGLNDLKECLIHALLSCKYLWENSNTNDIKMIFEF